MKMDVKEIRCVVVDRIDLTQSRDMWWAVVKTLMNLRDP
jgi:hypothetical protein